MRYEVKGAMRKKLGEKTNLAHVYFGYDFKGFKFGIIHYLKINWGKWSGQAGNSIYRPVRAEF